MAVKRDFSYSVTWNLILIIVGSLVQTIGFKAIAAAHGFVPSGLFGVAALIEYKSGLLNAGGWYLLLNVPMFILGYLLIGRRFLGYSFVSMLVISLGYMLIDFQLHIQSALCRSLFWRHRRHRGRDRTALIGFQWRPGRSRGHS